jgi:hypothetical protein
LKFRSSLVLLAITMALISGCGGEEDGEGPSASRAEQPSTAGGEQPAADRVAQARCPVGLSNCRTAQGRIAYVERVDPDGDGDAHFVIVDAQSITLPGLTAIDVRKGLRPQPLPGAGDLISAAGPVQVGSYGQRQIHALELNVAR